MRGAPLLEVRGLEIAYGPGPAALSVPALDVARGETLAVIGPNGAGKSTLFAALACLRPWTAGTLRFDGVPVERPGPAALAYRRQVAVVMQDPLLLDTTVLDNAAQGLRYRGVGRREAHARAAGWLERLGIGHLAGRPARHLSGGEAQRVSLARAMALDPKLLLLDEPFAPLDAPSRAAFIDDLRAVLAETGTTALLITHERSEALMLADLVAVLLAGRIVQVGTPTEVFETPATEAVAAFVGVETIEPGVIEATEDGVAVVTVGGVAAGRTAGERAGQHATGDAAGPGGPSGPGGSSGPSSSSGSGGAGGHGGGAGSSGAGGAGGSGGGGAAERGGAARAAAGRSGSREPGAAADPDAGAAAEAAGAEKAASGETGAREAGPVAAGGPGPKTGRTARSAAARGAGMAPGTPPGGRGMGPRAPEGTGEGTAASAPPAPGAANPPQDADGGAAGGAGPGPPETTGTARPVRVEVRSPLPAGTPVFLCLRPEDVAVSLPVEVEANAARDAAAPAAAAGREAPTSVRNRLPGVVRSVVPLEGQFRITLDCGFPLVALVTKRAFLELDLREGRPVVAWFKATAAHLLPRRGVCRQR